MKKGRVFWLLGCMVLLAGCSSGSDETSSTGESAENFKQEFTLTEQQEVPSIDASVSNDVVGWGVLKNTGEGLYRADKNGEMVPAGAAEEPEISEDGLVYTFRLREDAVWSNGDPITAQDYVYGWQRTAMPETASEMAYLYAPLKNYETIANGEMDPSELGIKALGDYELEIEFVYPVPYAESLLALPTFFPQSQVFIEEQGEDYGKSSEQAIYNGPFVLVEFDGPGVDMDWGYEKNETYWDKDSVKMERINVEVVKEDATALNLFQDGQVDDIIISGELAQQMQNDNAFFSQEKSSVYYIEFNQEKDVLANENFRKAVSCALDRDAIVNNILGDGSIAATSIVPRNMSFNPDTDADFIEDAGNLLVFDTEKAKEHWELAKNELGIETASIDVLASDSDAAKKVAEYIQGALNETLEGVEVTISAVPFSVRLERSNAGDFDLVFGGWGAEYNDPCVFLELFQSDNVNNEGGYANADFDKHMIASATTNAGNPSERWQNLLDANEVLMDTMGTCPVYQKAECHMRNPKLKGVLAAGPEYDYKWSYMEE